MKPLALFVLLAAAAAGAPAPAAPVPAPPPGGELLVMNDGLKPVTGVRLRPAGGGGGWSANLVAGEAIPVNEGRRLDIAPLKLGCQVEVELTVQGQAGPVLGEQAVCEDPRFWVGFALGLDEPGRGRGFAIRAEEAPGAEAPSKPVATRPRIDLNRGLPVCPGDPRCRKKK